MQTAVDRHGRDEVVFVSGGCPSGADAFCKEFCKLFDWQYKEHPVDQSTPITSKWEFRKRAFARNELIAFDSDFIFAEVSNDRTGGTEDTIGHMRRLRKPVFVVLSDGSIYLEHGQGAAEAGGPQAEDAVVRGEEPPA